MKATPEQHLNAARKIHQQLQTVTDLAQKANLQKAAELHQKAARFSQMLSAAGLTKTALSKGSLSASIKK